MNEDEANEQQRVIHVERRVDMDRRAILDQWRKEQASRAKANLDRYIELLALGDTIKDKTIGH